MAGAWYDGQFDVRCRAGERLGPGSREIAFALLRDMPMTRPTSSRVPKVLTTDLVKFGMPDRSFWVKGQSRRPQCRRFVGRIEWAVSILGTPLTKGKEPGLLGIGTGLAYTESDLEVQNGNPGGRHSAELECDLQTDRNLVCRCIE